MIIKRYYDNHTNSSSPNQSLEAVLDQLIATKYSMYFVNVLSRFFFFREGKPVVSNAKTVDSGKMKSISGAIPLDKTLYFILKYFANLIIFQVNQSLEILMDLLKQQ